MSKNLEEALREFDFYKEPSEVHDFSQEGKDLGVISFCWFVKHMLHRA